MAQERARRNSGRRAARPGGHRAPERLGVIASASTATGRSSV